MDPRVEAAFDAWLASMGLNRNSPIPYGQETQLLASWEAYLLNYGAQQGRTILAAPGQVGPGGVYQGAPGGSFNVPTVPGGGFTGGQYGQPYSPSGNRPTYPVATRIAAPVGGGQSPQRYTPPPNQAPKMTTTWGMGW